MVHFLQGNLLLATPVPPQAGKKGRAREPKFARMDSARERESERERERCTLSLYNLIYPYILMYIHMHRYISESQPAVSCRTSTYSTWRIISLRKWLIICCWKAWFRCPRTRIIQFTAGFKHRCVCEWCVPGSKWQFNGEQYFINTRWPFFIFFPH